MGVLRKNLVTIGYHRLPTVTKELPGRLEKGDVPAVVEIEVVLKIRLSGIKSWG